MPGSKTIGKPVRVKTGGMKNKPSYEELTQRVKELEEKVSRCDRTEETLRETRQRYERLIDSVDIGVAVISRNMEIVSANRRIKQWFPDVDVSITPSCYQVLTHPPGDEACAGCPVVRTLEDGRVHQALVKRTVNGEIRTLRVVSSPLMDNHNQVTAALEVMEDISDSVQSRESLDSTRGQLEQLLISSPAVIYSARASDNFPLTFIGNNVKAELGLEPEELLNKPDFWTDFVHPEDAARVLTEIPRVFEQDGHTIEYRFKRKDGVYRWIHNEMKLMRDPEGNPFEIVGFMTDVDSRKRFDEALKESENRFRTLVNNSFVGIFIVQDDKILFQNPQQEKLFGPLPAPFLFETLVNRVHTDDLPRFNKFYERVLSGDAGVLETEARFFTGNDAIEIRWIHCHASLIEFQGSNAVLFNMMDVTRRKELEQLVLIREKMASLGHVATGIAHDIKTPLAGIHVHLDVAKDKLEESENSLDVKVVLDRAVNAVNRIDSVVKRVLDFSRPGVPCLALADVNTVIEDAIELSKATFQKSGISLETRLCKDLAEICIDTQLIEQVMLNLIANADEAMQQGGRQKNLLIISEMKPNYVVVRVSDSGPGVSPEVRDRIFRPFFTSKADGSGIGLSICQRIIADHGGTISVSASPSGGAEFSFCLPVEKRLSSW